MTSVLNLFEMLLSIADKDRQKCLASSSLSLHQQQQAASSQLERLICSLQARLLVWCQQHLTGGEEEEGHREADDESHLIVQTVIIRCMYER